MDAYSHKVQSSSEFPEVNGDEILCSFSASLIHRRHLPIIWKHAYDYMEASPKVVKQLLGRKSELGFECTLNDPSKDECFHIEGNR